MATASIITTILVPCLGTGFASTAITWWVSRRKRNNDFLAEMQKSIDLLSEQYNKVLQENVELSLRNAELLKNQHQMGIKIDALNKKIYLLTTQLVNKKNAKKKNSNPTTGATGNDAVDAGMQDKTNRGIRRKKGSNDRGA